MSDDAPKPAPQAAATPERSVSVPMTSFVRGGSVTGAYEQQQKEKRAAAEKRRAEEAARQKVAARDPNANISTTKLGGASSHAAIVLTSHMNSDGKAEEFIVCELTVDRDNPGGLMLIVCCPFCAVRHGSDEAQMTIRSSHRKFELDTRRQGELWVNPKQPTEFVHLAGTIHLTDAVTCPGQGCAKRFKIDDSVIKWL